MGKTLSTVALSGFLFLAFGCAGMKVVNPNDKNENEGTLALDLSGGTPKLVETYTCKIVASNGQKVSATGKTEDEARSEAVAKCRDKTLISFCDAKKAKCVKN